MIVQSSITSLKSLNLKFSTEHLQRVKEVEAYAQFSTDTAVLLILVSNTITFSVHGIEKWVPKNPSLGYYI